jgi:predicted NAD-dependent protein-ADP-ribosyltransferase YbiA (DUF1768 family)
MDTVLYHKFTQHYGLKRELLATGDAELIEVRFLFWTHPLARLMKLLIELRQRFWGCGADGKGRNELGKALGRLRNRLHAEERR